MVNKVTLIGFKGGQLTPPKSTHESYDRSNRNKTYWL